jgi:SNF2 family DNA or RNA helicase
MAAKLTRVGDDTLELDLSACKGYDFKDALDKIRSVTGRRFDYDRKVWIVEATPDNAEQILTTIQPEADDELRGWVREARMKAAEELTTPLPDDAELLIPWATERQPWQPLVVNDEEFTGALPYQRSGIDHLAKQRRALLADDMGLGKTFQGISAVEEFVLRNGAGDGVTFPVGPRLVIAPNSVKGTWLRELRRWLDDPPVVMVDGSSPKTRHNQLQDGIKADAWCIVNWEQLRVKREKIKVQRRGGGVGQRTVTLMKEPLFEFPAAAAWDLNIDEWTWREHAKAKREELSDGWLAALADEVHRAKNRKAKQSEGLHRVRAKLMLGLTGTPLMNSPDELWSVLRWLYPMEYTSYWDFFERYVDYYEESGRGRIITGVKNPDALRFELKDRLVRRTARILNLKGRKRLYYSVPMNASQRKLYEDAEREMWLEVMRDIEAGDEGAERFAREAAGGAGPSTLIRIPNGAARLVRLQQIIESPALIGGPDDSALMDDVEQKIEDSAKGSQWVIGCKFRESCSILAARLKKKGLRVGVYTGEVKPADRTQVEDDFQKGDIDIIVGTLDALKEGITLTASAMMYMMTRFFVPDYNEQFEARCDRLGQQEQVLIYIPQAEESVATSKVEPINRVKERIVRAVVPKDEIQEVHS